MYFPFSAVPRRLCHGLCLVCLLAADIGSPSLALQNTSNAQSAPFGPLAQALEDGQLDEIRGGFDLPGSGLRVSFGIERAVHINGELVASTVLNIKDLQAAIGGVGGAVVVGEVGRALSLIQNGVGNGFSVRIGPNLAGTVIQNSLDEQKIANITTIDATVNSARLMRFQALEAAIQDGLVNALRR